MDLSSAKPGCSYPLNSSFVPVLNHIVIHSLSEIASLLSVARNDNLAVIARRAAPRQSHIKKIPGPSFDVRSTESERPDNFHFPVVEVYAASTTLHGHDLTQNLLFLDRIIAG